MAVFCFAAFLKNEVLKLASWQVKKCQRLCAGKRPGRAARIGYEVLVMPRPVVGLAIATMLALVACGGGSGTTTILRQCTSIVQPPGSSIRKMARWVCPTVTSISMWATALTRLRRGKPMLTATNRPAIAARHSPFRLRDRHRPVLLRPRPVTGSSYRGFQRWHLSTRVFGHFGGRMQRYRGTRSFTTQ